MASRPHSQSAGSWPDFLAWLITCAALWFVLAGTKGWSFGIPTVLAAAWLARELNVQAWRVRLLRLPFFLGFFLRFAWVGAVDVARRSIHPSRPIAPGWGRFPLGAESARQRLTISAVVGLLPGTLASKIENGELHVHVIDQNADWQSTLARLDREVRLLLPGEPGRSS